MVCVLAIAVASLCLFVKFSSAVPSALLDQASLKVNSLGVEKLHRGTKKYIELLKNVGEDLPNTIHKTIGHNKTKDRVVIVGDVHGCLDEFKELIQKVNYDESSDVLLLTGDVSNKGPYPWKVIQEVQRLGGTSVRGNNDDAALAAYEAMQDGRQVPEAFSWVKELRLQDAQWLYELPWSVGLPHLDLFVDHSGCVPGTALDKQSLYNLYEVREVVPTDNEGHWRMTKEGESGEDWASIYEGPTHIVFGHDSKRGLQERKFATGLDTGCVYGNRLTALLIEADKQAVEARMDGGDLKMKFVSVKAHEKYA